MMQIVEQTNEEKIAMYMKCTKVKLIEMLMENQRMVNKLTPSAIYYQDDWVRNLDDGLPKKISLQEQNKVLREALQTSLDEFESHWDANDTGSGTSKLITQLKAALEQTK